MAVIFDENFQGAGNAVVMTTANSDFDSLVESGWTFSNSLSVESTQSGRCAATGTSVIASDDFSALSAGFLRFYIYVDSRPSGNTVIAQMKSAATMRAELQLGPSGELRMRNSSSTAILTTPTETTPGDAWCRVEWMYNNTTARQRVKVYSGTNLNGTTPDYDSGDVVTTAAGTFTRLSVGVCVAATMTAYWDSVILDSAAFAAPIGGGGGPTASAGANQTGKEPGELITLTGTDTGTGLTRTWTQTAGSPTVTLSGTGATRTFRAPPTNSGTTLTFQYSVSNISGSASDTMTVQAVQASDYVLIGGVWTPAYWEIL